MSEWTPQTWWNLLIGAANALTLLAVVVLVLKHRKPSPPKVTFTGTATYCGHCGKKLGQDPERAIAVGETAYFVYRCRSCKQETLLPTTSL